MQPSPLAAHATTIVAGIGPHDEGRDTLAVGITLAAAQDARLLLAAVDTSASAPARTPSDGAAGTTLVQRLKEAAALVPEEVVCHTKVITAASVVGALHDLAQRERARVLVLGPTHLDPVALAARGDVALGALHGTPCPVAISPAGYAERPAHALRRLGVAWDGSAESDEALAEAVVLAERQDGSVQLFHAPDRRLPSVHRHETLLRLRGAAAAAAHRVPVDTMLLEHHPATDLVAATGELDLLVMGSRGYGPVRRAVRGSVSAQIVHRAACPILIVPRGVRGAAAR
jgi:nucleotide-binding universal stress UspA family protein